MKEAGAEQQYFDDQAYFLGRAYVEVSKLRKEKSVGCRTKGLPHAEKELAERISQWECFRRDWSKVTEEHKRHESNRNSLLKSLRQEVCKITSQAFEMASYRCSYPVEAFYRPRGICIERLKERLNEHIVGFDIVEDVIEKIEKWMLNKHDSGVAGAFLFWGANSCAKLELA
ncbi:hypothetical protein OROHE_022942 [Orobanche hederae]